jgi:hypothetical protein
MRMLPSTALVRTINFPPVGVHQVIEDEPIFIPLGRSFEPEVTEITKAINRPPPLKTRGPKPEPRDPRPETRDPRPENQIKH